VSPRDANRLAARILGVAALAASFAAACTPDPVRDPDVLVYVQREAGAVPTTSSTTSTPDVDASARDAAPDPDASGDASIDASIDASARALVRLTGTADLRWTERSPVPPEGCAADSPELPYRTTTCCTRNDALSDTAVSAVPVTVDPTTNTVTVGTVPLVYGPKSYWQGVMSWSSSAHCIQILRAVAASSTSSEAPRARAFVNAVALRCPVAEWNEDEAAYAPYLGTAFVSASYRDLVEAAPVGGCESTAKVTLQLGLRP
jgi:hypothetical protein